MEHQIGEKPLILYILGKSICDIALTFVFVYSDSIKNVINAGNEFTRENYRTLMTTFDEFDRTKTEVKL